MDNSGHRYNFLLPCSIIILMGILVEFSAMGQVNDTLSSKSLDSVKLLKIPLLLSRDSIHKKPDRNFDSMWKKLSSTKIDSESIPKFKKSHADSILEKLQNQLYSARPLITLKNGVVNYNFTYRSKLDTPYLGNNIQQHFANLSANILVAQKLPLRVSVYERRSNSSYFRNYTDVRIEFNAPEYRRMQTAKLHKYFNDLLSRLQDPELKSTIDIQQILLSDMKSYFHNSDVIKQYLESKETIIYKEELSGSQQYKDSIINQDSTFIAFYEEKRKELQSLENGYDSLKNKYQEIIKKVQYIRQIFVGNINSPNGSDIIINTLKEAGLHDRHFEKSIQALYAVQTLSIGKGIPDYSALTVKNIEVNGFNAEINKNNLYYAVLGGIVNFNARDFVFKNQKVPRQYVTAARIGFGKKQGNHIILTGYRGQ